MSGRTPIAAIDDYTSGLLDDAEAAAFEESLFEGAAEGKAEELAFLDTLKRIAPWFAARGGFVGGITRAKHMELRAGPNVHYFDIETGGPSLVHEWPADTKLVVYRIDVDLRGYEDVELHVSMADGTPLKSFRGIEPDPTDGAIYGCCDEPLARATFLEIPIISRIEATRDGKRETIATVDLRPA